MLKRGNFTDKERALRNKVEAEHALFRYRMLASGVKEVYDNCIQISFYECIYEYFTYFDNFTDEMIAGCLMEDHVINALWEVYVKYEYLRYDTWEKISDLINSLILRRKEEQNGELFPYGRPWTFHDLEIPEEEKSEEG